MDDRGDQVGRLVEDASIRKAREMNASTEIINTEISHARTFDDVPRTTTGIDAAVRQMYENEPDVKKVIDDSYVADAEKRGVGGP